MSQELSAAVRAGQTALGIEFGSTRIKACLVGPDLTPIASGAHAWENQYVDGVWTYGLDEVWAGLQACIASLLDDVEERVGVRPTTFGAIGISAMMHGYLAFDEHDELLVPFRTWRNTTTQAAADELTPLLGFNVPLRWSVAHFYQAVLDREPHVAHVRHLTTLAGYVHWRLTGERVLGVGDASGMFPVDATTRTYDAGKLATFDHLLRAHGVERGIDSLLPAVLVAGENAGRLTAEGAALLDPSGTVQPGIPFCPPEGDAGTGMVATNAVAPRTGNVSVGTSIFAMVVLERPLESIHAEIDVVATPVGDPVAMVHCNNGASEIDAWARVFGQFARAAGQQIDDDEVFGILLGQAVEAAPNAGGLVAYNNLAGEPVTGLAEGRPLVVRTPDSALTLPNLMRAQIYGAFATLSLGMRILDDEQVAIDSLVAHGGLFRTAGVAQQLLAAALGIPIAVGEAAGEGGAWGIALLAAFSRAEQDDLAAFLSRGPFSRAAVHVAPPDERDADGFADYLRRYQAGLPIQQAAVSVLSTEPEGDTPMNALYSDEVAAAVAAARVRVATLHEELTRYGLSAWTSGNVSERVPVDGGDDLFVIKGSGVRYHEMTPEDMVVCDLDGKVVEGTRAPSSDTAAHAYVYRHMPEVGGVVHTHSTYAAAWAARGEEIPCVLTMVADEFGGPVPVGPFAIIGDDSIGRGIVETLRGSRSPADLMRNHGPFTIGPNGTKAVAAAVMVEEVARAVHLSRQLGDPIPIEQSAIDALYDRYQNVYGQQAPRRL